MHYNLFIHSCTWLLPSFGNYEQNCYKHSYAGSHMDLSFQITWVNSISGSYVYFCKKLQLSSKVAVWHCIPTSNEWESLVLHILTSVWVVSVLDISLSNRYVIGSHYCFNLQFPMGTQRVGHNWAAELNWTELKDIWCRTYLHMLICHLYFLS